MSPDQIKEVQILEFQEKTLHERLKVRESAINALMNESNSILEEIKDVNAKRYAILGRRVVIR